MTLGICAQRDVAEALAIQLGLPLVDAASYPEFPILEERVSARFLRESRALPVREDEAELALAMVDPTDDYTINAFEMVTGRSVRPMVAIPPSSCGKERLYGAASPRAADRPATSRRRLRACVHADSSARSRVRSPGVRWCRYTPTAGDASLPSNRPSDRLIVRYRSTRPHEFIPAAAALRR